MNDLTMNAPAMTRAGHVAVADDGPAAGLAAWSLRAGVAAPILALFATVVGAPLYADDLSDAAVTGRFTIAATASLAALLALALALVGVHLGHRGRLGRMGRAGVLVALAGTVLATGGAWDSLFTVPYLAERAPAVVDAATSGSLLAGYVISYLVFVAGWALVAAASLRARVVPRAASIVVLVGALLAVLPAPTALRILPLAFGVALTARALLRGR
jgi:hypothetical protein